MKVLGIETSGRICSIGLTDDDKLIAELKINIPNVHSEKLFQGVEVLLKITSLSMDDLSGVAVSSGPGSFTGLRIGLSAGKGIAYGLDVPFFLIPTLDVYANFGLGFGRDICSIIPSIREDYFFSFYKEKKGMIKRISDYIIGRIEKIEYDSDSELFFSGIIDEKLKSKLIKSFSNAFFKSEFDFSGGYIVARMGYEKMCENKKDDIENSVPLYLRDFDVKMKKNL